MHLNESRDQKLLLWAHTHVLGTLGEQNKGGRYRDWQGHTAFVSIINAKNILV